MQVFKCLY